MVVVVVIDPPTINRDGHGIPAKPIPSNTTNDTNVVRNRVLGRDHQPLEKSRKGTFFFFFFFGTAATSAALFRRRFRCGHQQFLHHHHDWWADDDDDDDDIADDSTAVGGDGSRSLFWCLLAEGGKMI